MYEHGFHLIVPHGAEVELAQQAFLEREFLYIERAAELRSVEQPRQGDVTCCVAAELNGVEVDNIEDCLHIYVVEAYAQDIVVGFTYIAVYFNPLAVAVEVQVVHGKGFAVAAYATG